MASFVDVRRIISMFSSTLTCYDLAISNYVFYWRPKSSPLSVEGEIKMDIKNSTREKSITSLYHDTKDDHD